MGSQEEGNKSHAPSVPHEIVKNLLFTVAGGV
jgi:hypothetical protein